LPPQHFPKHQVQGERPYTKSKGQNCTPSPKVKTVHQVQRSRLHTKSKGQNCTPSPKVKTVHQVQRSSQGFLQQNLLLCKITLTEIDANLKLVVLFGFSDTLVNRQVNKYINQKSLDHVFPHKREISIFLHCN
jgi:hypothetical protein